MKGDSDVELLVSDSLGSRCFCVVDSLASSLLKERVMEQTERSLTVRLPEYPSWIEAKKWLFEKGGIVPIVGCGILLFFAYVFDKFPDYFYR